MNILHIAHWMGTINGIAEVLITLTKEQIVLGHNVKILCTKVNEIYGANEYVKKIESISCFENVVQNHKPDLVIFHSLYRFNYPFYARILKKQGIPYAVEFHGAASKISRNKGYIKKSIADILLFNKFLKNANGVIYLNNDEKKSSVYSRIVKKYTIVPNGLYINTHYFQSTSRISDKIEFIYLGRIEYFYKGLAILLSALKSISKMPICKKIHFTFYGNGVDADRLKSEISNYSFIDYKGQIYGEEKCKALNSSDIMVLTSRSEGMPMGVLEALSFGCPCIVSEATNMASIVKDKAGWVTPLTKEGIVETIHKAVKDYQNNKGKYRNNSIEIAKQFEWSKVAELSIEKYKELL